MNILAEVLQYAGCLSIACSLVGYHHKHVSGPKLGLLGASLLVAWALMTGTWGLLALNVVCGWLYAWTWLRWSSTDA